MNPVCAEVQRFLHQFKLQHGSCRAIFPRDSRVPVFVLLICEVIWVFAESYNHLLDVLEATQTSYSHLFTL